jgi:tRNA modification GTPase
LLNIWGKDLLQRTRESLERTLADAKGGATVDLLAVGLEEVLEILGELTGENLSEEAIDRIFSNFCVVK